ncbi:hypothetical protein OX284_005520 [Flavobacterium sp. SUN046]|uniref:hypothetical protein n=1 Tax=Flavobacterium sp. SUN046 TaxID=3002440 RepID=UPI002DBCD55D|nr:hypothetical protein [Flavobacterium sp. SUN046]MEC4048876.1 hypothetical protein [Flavobacterium sp. SUN046]
MKLKVVYRTLILLLSITNCMAQFESPRKTIKISPMKSDNGPTNKVPSAPASAPIIKYESTINKENNPFKGISILPKKENDKSVFYKEPIRNPSEIFTDKMNHKKGDGEILEKYKSDSFLGQFTVGTRIIKIACRDHEFPDGDRVRIWLNDEVAVMNITLDTDYKEVLLDLNEGINKIEIEALNQGDSGPNTAQFTIVDEKGRLITNNKWNLTTGVKAKIVILKDKTMLEQK